jgi:CRISPR type III-B/RAMP module RAMP protein Cmr1
MKRKLPNVINHPQLSYKPAPDVIERTIRYKLITPLLGGGTESYKNDQYSLIRVSSIRGVLRFWWRATRGGLSHGDARHLRRLEARIWGGNCREYTADVKEHDDVVIHNGTFENGNFTLNGYTISWVNGSSFVVHHEVSKLYYDVVINQKTHHVPTQAIINAQNVTILRADIDRSEVVSLIVRVDDNNYKLHTTSSEVMHPSQVKMYVDSFTSDAVVQSENSPDNALVPRTGNNPIQDTKSILSYVLFPLRKVKNATIHTGVEFTLKVEYPQMYQPDVAASLWAWEHFGGLGARTRRGLGAVECIKIDDTEVTLTSLNLRIAEGLELHVVAGVWPTHTPHISGVHWGEYHRDSANMIISNIQAQQDPRQIWRQLFEKYRDFRQHRLLNNAHLPHGGNIWPEPNSLRQMARSNALRPVPPFNQPGFQNHFPRSQMGMPVEHFFRPPTFDAKITSDVKHTVNIRDIHTNKDGRFASPVLFRPVRDGNGYRGILVILGGTRAPTTAYLDNRNPIDVYGNPGAALLDRDRNPHGHTTTDDVLQGLFNFFNN